MKALALALVVALCLCAAVLAAENEALAPIANGFSSYRIDGAESAVRAWIAGGPLERSDVNLRNLTQGLLNIENTYGKYQKFHVVRTVPITGVTQLIFVQLDYANGPLFMKFLTFRTSTAIRIVSIKYHTDIERIWPNTLVGPAGDDQ